ncbi:hypothetical protein D9758_013590 [Tetrapyrgos nigripes]|uniref:Uncharacterized protein n=1 Tax=Tetrapyrgos nigripes TaxID=182062 RepID=A0A8H5CBH3_9AGAR|nr:hypothetical protein D9758_013590 [Tetrapyrgos nigripes]
MIRVVSRPGVLEDSCPEDKKIISKPPDEPLADFGDGTNGIHVFSAANVHGLGISRLHWNGFTSIPRLWTSTLDIAEAPNIMRSQSSASDDMLPFLASMAHSFGSSALSDCTH